MPPAFASRRERLALLCALDRARLRLALRPAPRTSPASSAIPKLDLLFAIVRCLPGRIGRWTRRFGFAADLFRLFAR